MVPRTGTASGRPSLVTLRQRLRQVRQISERLIAPLEPEDLCLQGMADASPPKWHLGHTTWFFEEFLLRPAQTSGAAAPELWRYLFNSYYDAVGARHPRPQRGLLSRPPIDAVLAWRQQVDQALELLLDRVEVWPEERARPTLALLELGLQHEQQHQELLLMDLLDGFSRNPLEPAYRGTGGRDRPKTAAALISDGLDNSAVAVPAWHDDPEGRFRALARAHDGPGHEGAAAGGGSGLAGWLSFAEGLVAIGHLPGSGGPEGSPGGFAFDHEGPRHRVWLEGFQIAERLVTNAEMAAFIAAGGYEQPEWWMSEGWAVARDRGWRAPRYWRGDDEFTLAGRQPRDPQAPVRHLSWFEADAYARWAGARLPSEAEWEVAAASGRLPQAFGLLWQWTASPYRPYPGFQPAAGAVGEYNGKFMSSQMVLRGSGFLTPPDHQRLTYRNFYPPASRWMAAGLRLARDGAMRAGEAA
ncbi:ergothioneine biosynthesis protein EgtB [Synechococcus sp. CCY9202]|uniref:ergothioneine biosynthesis protein EgtB n=1 Tax=Synechococcus sp. CCY9202 TaxID=174698 RepID=UPI002B1F77E5|nr:ergothioneine biosynthesis protein EgtB [Synechococcus sp. CCY9202]MEA5421800.1 ergothioneine biosynthesis protein EgtB [Synechococcus sp. CCY9202]